jgi:uncharacterized membrane protein
MPDTSDLSTSQKGSLLSALPENASAKTSSSTTLRRPSIDALRGLVMIIMALDHTRDFVHSGAMLFQPDDLTRTTAVLFFTRWVTHICAPVFSFSAGLGAFFWMSHGRTPAQLSSFLWKRGVWLAILDLTIVRFSLTFSVVHGILILSVLWALGWSMIALSLLVRLPIRWLTAGSIAVIALHNLTDSVDAARFGSLGWLWNILHQQGVFSVAGVSVLVAYPIVPWVAVMALGFCFGRVMMLEPQKRQRLLTRIGIGLIAAFLVVRGINVYGDPRPWSTAVPGMTVLSFLRCTKYPASLDFLLMTLGPALLLLAWFDRMKFAPTNPLIVFGRVPLFYFVVHLYVIHVLTFPMALLRYGTAGFLLSPLPSMGGPDGVYPPEYGYSLWTVYGVWIAVVLLLYPMCLWFARLKARKTNWWLGYL